MTNMNLVRAAAASPSLGAAAAPAFHLTIASGNPIPGLDLPTCCPVIDSTTPDNFCSGVLIAPRLALTASHAAPDSCYIRIPSAHVYDGKRVDVAKVISARTPGNSGPDLALLVLATEVTAIAPAVLPSHADFEDGRTTGITLSGFGFTRDAFGNLADAGIKRRSRQRLLIDDPELATQLGAGPLEFVAGGQFDGVIHDAETGDSGGPAYLFGTEIVLGIVSRNASGHKSIFTRVDEAMGWIEEVAEQEGICLRQPLTATAP